MNAGFESCVTFTLVFVTFAVTMCQGQTRQTCHIHSRPHRQGVCGVRLTTAHQNLCFLMSIRYPAQFPQKKRSAEGLPSLEDLYSIPISVLAELDLKNDENWASYILENEQRTAEESDEARDKTATNHLGREIRAELPRLKSSNSPTAELLRMLSKRGGVQKRDNHGMVCDCCFNLCTTAQLATYC